MNRIEIRELWNDSTGQFCSEISIDGRKIASVYSPDAERILVGAIRDRHCAVYRKLRGRPAQKCL